MLGSNILRMDLITVNNSSSPTPWIRLLALQTTGKLFASAYFYKLCEYMYIKRLWSAKIEIKRLPVIYVCPLMLIL